MNESNDVKNLLYQASILMWQIGNIETDSEVKMKVSEAREIIDALLRKDIKAKKQKQ